MVAAASLMQIPGRREKERMGGCKYAQFARIVEPHLEVSLPTTQRAQNRKRRVVIHHDQPAYTATK